MLTPDDPEFDEPESEEPDEPVPESSEDSPLVVPLVPLVPDVEPEVCVVVRSTPESTPLTASPATPSATVRPLATRLPVDRVSIACLLVVRLR
jgi:hypothetical protein